MNLQISHLHAGEEDVIVSIHNRAFAELGLCTGHIQ